MPLMAEAWYQAASSESGCGGQAYLPQSGQNGLSVGGQKGQQSGGWLGAPAPLQ